MTEITKFNFVTKLVELFDEIRAADFIAIDTNAEVTGFLMINESINPYLYESEIGWYEHVFKNQKTKSPTDFGVAIFKRRTTMPSKILSDEDDASNRFTIKCYSIPILFACVDEHDARTESRQVKSSEERLDLDGFGFEFIQQTQLDLNKVLYAGTPFMNLERQLDAKTYMKENPDFMLLGGPHVINGDLDEFYFPKIIPKLNEQDIQEIISRLRGIGKIFDVIAQTKVPVVGHNLLIKLMLLYKDFVEYLPKQFSEFLVKLDFVLPHFYDTKFIAWEIHNRKNITEKAKKSVGSGLLDQFQLYRQINSVGRNSFEFIFEGETEADEFYEEDLKVLCTDSLEEESDSFCHESGFDACLAGIIFLKLAVLDMNESTSIQNMDNDFFRSKINPDWKNNMFMQQELTQTKTKENLTPAVAGGTNSLNKLNR